MDKDNNRGMRDWLIFIRNAEAGSISEAARQLNISTAAISRFENYLGAVLFNRTSQGISLTSRPGLSGGSAHDRPGFSPIFAIISRSAGIHGLSCLLMTTRHLCCSPILLRDITPENRNRTVLIDVASEQQCVGRCWICPELIFLPGLRPNIIDKHDYEIYAPPLRFSGTGIRRAASSDRSLPPRARQRDGYSASPFPAFSRFLPA
ncbi:hypothetical protein ABIE06_004305 [Pantoea dispersa]